MKNKFAKIIECLFWWERAINNRFTWTISFFMLDIEYSTCGVCTPNSTPGVMMADWLLFSSSLYPYDTGPDDLRQKNKALA